MSPILDQSRTDLFQAVVTHTRVGRISAAPLQDYCHNNTIAITGADQVRTRSNAKPINALPMSAAGTFVWTGRALQAECEDLEMIGLALLYPALERSVCAPGHHGYPRTSDLILRKALKGR